MLPQTDKQRIIWAYKILFLDVLFPLNVDRIIFVDSDQVVRTDLGELYDMDIKVWESLGVGVGPGRGGAVTRESRAAQRVACPSHTRFRLSSHIHPTEVWCVWRRPLYLGDEDMNLMHSSEHEVCTNVCTMCLPLSGCTLRLHALLRQ